MIRYAVIMAGGSGERFWPLSTADEPKQLLRLTNSGKMLLEEAVDRIAPVVGEENVYISTSRRLADKIAESGIVPRERILDEPMKRNTLGAVLWSMSRLQNIADQPFSVAFTTADHLIEPDDEFQEAVLSAMVQAEVHDTIAIIGVQPTRAETGFGYLEVDGEGGVTRFAEKPDAETAQQYLEAGNFLWNSGMFFMTNSGLEQIMEEIDPLLAGTYEQLKKDKSAFEHLPSISFDFAVLEKAPGIRYVPGRFRWDDIGSWDSLLRTTSRDESGNALIGTHQVVDANDNVVYCTRPGVRVNLLGVTGLAVIVTDDEVVVLDLNRSQDVRGLAQK